MMVGVKQRYRYRLYPHPHQQMALAKAFGCARVVWNDALVKSRALYAAGEKTSYPVLAKLCITQAKQTPERSWLSGPSNVVLQQSVRDLDQAFRNWWASLKGKRKGPKVKPPRFKKRRGAQAIRFMSHVFRTGERSLTLSKIGIVPIEWSRDLPSAPSSVTVIRDASGRYFASFVVEVEPTPLPANGKAVGIDLGLASLAVTSAGEKIAPPKFLRSALKRLRRLQRLQRNIKHKQKGSNRLAAARRQMAKLHASIADKRLDFLHQLSTRIIRENQTVVLEDLNVSGMLKNRKLARSIADAGWRQFRTLLESKAEQYGRQLVVINRWLPTSQVCSTCGHRDGKKELSIRQWQCPSCEAAHDRDVNAAQNILAAGLAESQNGRGAAHQSTALVAAGWEAPTHPIAEAHLCPA
jgi:putative transposase